MRGRTLMSSPGLLLWLMLFAYTATAALLVQLVVLPYFFPQWHAGDGLLVGGDWLVHHRLGVGLAQEIRTKGWSAWELRPEGQGPAGIAGAIYALTWPKPWTLIPLNAALHAFAALVLLQIMRLFLGNRGVSLLAIVPFFLFPSAGLWTTQILKDGYSIAGFLLFLYGFLLLARLDRWRRARWLPVVPLVWMMIGTALIWIVRPYMLRIMQGIVVGLALYLTVVFVFRLVRAVLPWRKAIPGVLLPWGLVFFLTLVLSWGSEVVWVEVPEQNVNAGINGETSGVTTGIDWESSRWLPDSLENFFYTLAISRYRSCTLNPDAASNIDVDVEFRSALDVVSYLPRATQIAFFAPYPNQWFEQGSYGTTTLMRRVSAAEMIGVYAALILVPFSLWRWRRWPETWILTLFCSGMMMSYGLVVANIGSLYRVRYGFLMTLVALGIAGGLAQYQRLRHRDRKGMSGGNKRLF